MVLAVAPDWKGPLKPQDSLTLSQTTLGLALPKVRHTGAFSLPWCQRKWEFTTGSHWCPYLPFLLRTSEEADINRGIIKALFVKGKD